MRQRVNGGSLERCNILIENSDVSKESIVIKYSPLQISVCGYIFGITLF